MTEVQKLQAALKIAKAAAKSAKPAKNKRIPLSDRPTAPLTTGVSMERRPESFEGVGGKAPWGVDHALLRFHGENDVCHGIGSKLDTADATGLELVEEIKSYAKANRVGNSKVRFDPSLGAWKGRADMFPPRLRKIAGYEIKS
jgi:hypothetical protein